MKEGQKNSPSLETGQREAHQAGQQAKRWLRQSTRPQKPIYLPKFFHYLEIGNLHH